jgi:hypothetical protein
MPSEIQPALAARLPDPAAAFAPAFEDRLEVHARDALTLASGSFARRRAARRQPAVQRGRAGLDRARLMMLVAVVGGREQRPGVEKDHAVRPSSSRKMSSDRAAKSTSACRVATNGGDRLPRMAATASRRAAALDFVGLGHGHSAARRCRSWPETTQVGMRVTGRTAWRRVAAYG